MTKTKFCEICGLPAKRLRKRRVIDDVLKDGTKIYQVKVCKDCY